MIHSNVFDVFVSFYISVLYLQMPIIYNAHISIGSKKHQNDEKKRHAQD